MFKDYMFSGNVAPDKHVALQQYLIKNHAPEVLNHAAFVGVFKRFTANKAIYTETELLYHGRSDIPLIVEHVCQDRESYSKALQDYAYNATVTPDEELENFDKSVPVVLEVDERVVVAGRRIGKLRIFDFMRRRQGLSEEAFSGWLEAEGALLATSQQFRKVATRYVHNIVKNGDTVYGQSGRFQSQNIALYDAVVETWVTSPGELVTVYPQIRARHSDYVDSSASFSLLTEEVVLSESLRD